MIVEVPLLWGSVHSHLNLKAFLLYFILKTKTVFQTSSIQNFKRTKLKEIVDILEEINELSYRKMIFILSMQIENWIIKVDFLNRVLKFELFWYELRR